MTVDVLATDLYQRTNAALVSLPATTDTKSQKFPVHTAPTNRDLRYSIGRSPFNELQ